MAFSKVRTRLNSTWDGTLYLNDLYLQGSWTLPLDRSPSWTDGVVVRECCPASWNSWRGRNARWWLVCSSLPNQKCSRNGKPSMLGKCWSFVMYIYRTVNSWLHPEYLNQRNINSSDTFVIIGLFSTLYSNSSIQWCDIYKLNLFKLFTLIWNVNLVLCNT